MAIQPVLYIARRFTYCHVAVVVMVVMVLLMFPIL